MKVVPPAVAAWAKRHKVDMSLLIETHINYLIKINEGKEVVTKIRKKALNNGDYTAYCTLSDSKITAELTRIINARPKAKKAS